MNKGKEYHIEVYEDSGKKYVLLEDLQTVLKAGQEIQRRINKAIEYIERNCLEFNVKYACQGLNNDKVDVLLDILRGEDSE